MDEKTDELRDVFREVTDRDTVTESQAPERGSLVDADDDAVADRLDDVIARMRERYDFETDLSAEALRRVVRGFYDGEDDETIAAAIDDTPESVFRARMDLQLLRDADLSVDLERLQDRRGDNPAAVAADLDVPRAVVDRGLAVLEARERIRRTSHRFLSAFEDAIPDAALSVALTDVVTEDGLEEAAEDIETDTQF